MVTYHKSYRFPMSPTVEQERDLVLFAGARRWVWNWGLTRRKEYYKEHGKSIPAKQLLSELTRLKYEPSTEWLRKVDSQLLQQALRDLDKAFCAFFEKRARYPRYKSRKRDTFSFRIPQGIRVVGRRVRVPKVGYIPIRQSRTIEESIKGATFRCTPEGKWYVTFTTEFKMPDLPLPALNLRNTIGLDLGLKDFVVCSNGERFPAPRFFRCLSSKLRKAQRSFSRRKQGSKRREKARCKVARIHQQIVNKRSDFLHKLSTSLVCRYDGLCIEDLALRGLARTKLAKSFADASMGEFRRQLSYKTKWNYKHLVEVDRFFPSSRLCYGCKLVNKELKLSDRNWICSCGLRHDRDLSAALNIRDEGLRILAVGPTDKQNARGVDVSPCNEAIDVEPRISLLRRKRQNRDMSWMN